MKVDFKFSIGDDVQLCGSEAHGKVVGLYLDNTNCQHARVRVFDRNGGIVEQYFLESEIRYQDPE